MNPFRPPFSAACQSGKSIQQRRWVVMICATLGTAFLASEANATCGDYLHHSDTSVQEHKDSTLLSSALTGGARTSEQTPSPIPVKRCNGPQCSQWPVPFAPVPAAPGQLSQGLDPAAILETLRPVCASSQGRMLPESERADQFEHISVFRPPAT